MENKIKEAIKSKIENIQNPPQVGGYNLIGGKDTSNSIQFMLTEKPSLWHRMWTRFFLGWTWIDK